MLGLFVGGGNEAGLYLGGGTFSSHKQWGLGSLLALCEEMHSFLGVSPEPALAADASLQLSV